MPLGKFKTYKDGQMTLSYDDGPDVAYPVPEDVGVILNGVNAKVSDLLPGDVIEFIGVPVVLIKATRQLPRKE